MEIYLAECGFGNIYEAHISRQKKQLVTAAPGDPAYWQQVWEAQDKTSKPLLALEVIAAMQAQGSPSVPRKIVDVLSRVRQLARQ